MRGARLLRWSGTVQSPRIRPRASIQQRPFSQRHRLRAATALQFNSEEPVKEPQQETHLTPQHDVYDPPSPPVQVASHSPKLSSLHSRLSLPQRLPLETLARTLIDSSADPSIQFNNRPLSSLGHDLLGYYASEYILAKYPRLPMAVVFAAMWAYVGPRALATITKEWGVDYVAEPGSEVDPGLLQFKRLPPGEDPDGAPDSYVTSRSEKDAKGYRRGWSSRSVYDDEFGELKKEDNEKGVTAERASTNFVRALVGAIHLHGGRPAAKQFFRDHFMSRQLDMANLFSFKMPTRDLSRLCAREGFQPPVARIMSETGRKSRHPVFIVGVYSGRDKLGEGAGASLDEARIRAAISALKGWYLYSPLELRLPSDTEEDGAKPWTPSMVDVGEVVV